MERRHRVVVVGAGFGGLAVARALRDVPVDVVIVDANNFHTFQPLLYQVATAGLAADDICYPTRGIFHRHRRVDVVMGRVDGVDLAARALRLDDGSEQPYDTLVLASGAVTNHFGTPGATEHTLGLKTLADAEAVRTRVLRAFERAAVRPELVDDGGLNVVVVGGGPTGVELAGGMQELYTRVLAKDFPHLDVRRARVVLVEAGDRLLASFAPRLSERAAATLRSRGVEVVLGTGVAVVDGDGVRLSTGQRIPAGTVVWAAGIAAPRMAGLEGLATARGGRLVVEADLSIPGHPEVFAIGDVAASVDHDGTLLPQVAPVAIQGGQHVAAQVARRRRGEPSVPFAYRDKGSMATIGRHDAVAQLPSGRTFTGFVGWVAWLGLHLVELMGFRNRLNVLIDWGWNYLTYDRSARRLSGED